MMRLTIIGWGSAGKKVHVVSRNAVVPWHQTLVRFSCKISKFEIFLDLRGSQWYNRCSP